MPCSIKNNCVRNIWHNLSCSLNSANVCRHVKRSEWNNSLEFLNDIVSDEGALLKELAAMQDSVAYCTDLRNALNDSVLGISNHFDDKFYCLFVGGACELVSKVLSACCLVLNC